MSKHLQHSLRIGLIFGGILIFLMLIGFAGTAALLVEQASNPEAELGTSTGLMVFLALIGLWTGSNSVDRSEDRGWGQWLLSGLVAGLGASLIAGIFVLILSGIHSSGADVDMRDYLAQFSPEAVSLLTLSPSGALTAALTYAGILTASSVVGALLARLLSLTSFLSSLGTRASTSLQSSTAMKSLGRNRVVSLIFYGVMFLLLMALPLALNRYWNFTLGTVGIYVLLGLGLNIVVGLAGLLDLGYVAFFAVGAYTVALLTAPVPHHLLWPFWLTVPVGLVLAAALGVALGVPVLRLRGDYLAIVTLGFGEIIRVMINSDVLQPFFNGAAGIPGVKGPQLQGLPFDEREYLWLIILAIALAMFVTERLQNSRIGRAWIAIREDETVAQAMGINTLKYKLLAFGIGAAFAGLGGLISASRTQFTAPADLTLLVSINVLAVVIVGGMGSIPGVVLGALVLKGLPEVLRQFQDYRIVLFGALLVVMMIVRPEGLWPSQRRRLEMHASEEDAEAKLPPDPSVDGEVFA
jgi:ABC-type branched-subunit amino acid transport system permease subunit